MRGESTLPSLSYASQTLPAEESIPPWIQIAEADQRLIESKLYIRKKKSVGAPRNYGRALVEPEKPPFIQVDGLSPKVTYLDGRDRTASRRTRK